MECKRMCCAVLGRIKWLGQTQPILVSGLRTGREEGSDAQRLAEAKAFHQRHHHLAQTLFDEKGMRWSA